MIIIYIIIAHHRNSLCSSNATRRYVTDSEDEDPVVEDMVLSDEQKAHLEFSKAFMDRLEMPEFQRPVAMMTGCQGLS